MTCCHDAALLAAIALAGAGCTFGEGEPFGELEATLDARYLLLSDRDAGEPWQKLDNDFEVRVDALELSVPAIDLEDIGEGAAGFDPSRPPEGYSLCHNGHCHRDDGALVPYEEIAGGGSTSLVATLPIGELDLAAGVSGALPCGESCLLPRGRIGRARLYAERIAASGEVRDGRATPRFAGALAWSLSSDLGTSETDPSGLLDLALDVPIDREEAPRVHLELALRLTATLLDSIAFDELAQQQGGTSPLDLAADEASHARALQNFAETAFYATVTRRDD